MLSACRRKEAPPLTGLSAASRIRRRTAAALPGLMSYGSSQVCVV
jgi:hypothetical protein